MGRNGWVLGPDGELLCWIPWHLRTGLERPGVRIIGQFERLTMDMSDFVYGEEWTRVREGGGVW